MKTNLLFLSLILGAFNLTAQNVGIGTSSPLDYAKLDISSSTSGLQLPRMTTTQRTTLAGNIAGLTPALSAQYSGMIVYDLTTSTMYMWDASKSTNGAWVNILDADASLADADADATNELQNLSSTASGTDRTINISSGTGTTISVADNDNSTTNEIQDLSISGNTLSLSSDATTVDLSSFKDHDWYESPGTTQADNIADNIYTNGNVAIGSTSATANMKLDVNGNLFARKYVVQNSTDGGADNGIFMWDENDSNWGIYMGQSGAGKSLSGGSAVAGGGFSAHAIRFRVASSTTQGFIFENNAEQNLFSIRGGNGRATFKGGVLFDCDGCGSTTTIDGTSDWGDLTIQGRVLSANSNIHLSPPGGSNVVINDAYRAAGGSSTGAAGLQVESLAGTGERPLYVDANGVLKEGRPIGFVSAFSSSMRHSPDDVNGTTLNGDDVTTDYTLPFTFNVGGTNYTTIRVSSNGFVTFGTTAGSLNANNCLPSASFSDPVICAYWDDLVTEDQHIEIEQGGSAGGRVVTIKAEAYKYNNSGQDVNYEIMIHEGGLITVNYWGDINSVTIGQEATIGFQTAGGSSSKAYSVSCDEEVIDDNDERQAWSIYIPQAN